MTTDQALRELAQVFRKTGRGEGRCVRCEEKLSTVPHVDCDGWFTNGEDLCYCKCHAPS